MDSITLEFDREYIMIKKLFRNLIYKTSLDFVHPIGSFYDTDDADFDPNKVWGGSWELYVNRVRVGAGDLYQLGDEFGEAEVKLKFTDYQFGHWSPRSVESQQVNTNFNGGSGNIGLRCAYSDNLEGINTAHNNLQPSYAVYMWHRIA